MNLNLRLKDDTLDGFGCGRVCDPNFEMEERRQAVRGWFDAENGEIEIRHGEKGK